MRYRYAFSAIILVTSFSAAGAKKAPQLTALELQQIQSREFEVPKSVSFPAVMSMFQDAGYRIGTADLATGLITAVASTKSKLTWTPFIGFGRSKKSPIVSAFIEDRGRNMSRIRLSFVMGKVSTTGFGGGVTDEDPITDPAVYQDAFEKISKEVFVRQALDAPVPASAPSPASTAAPATSTANAAGNAPQGNPDPN